MLISNNLTEINRPRLSTLRHFADPEAASLCRRVTLSTQFTHRTAAERRRDSAFSLSKAGAAKT
jgi:hypothetical protein